MYIVKDATKRLLAKFLKPCFGFLRICKENLPELRKNGQREPSHRGPVTKSDVTCFFPLKSNFSPFFEAQQRLAIIDLRQMYMAKDGQGKSWMPPVPSRHWIFTYFDIYLYGWSSCDGRIVRGEYRSELLAGGIISQW